VPLPTVDNSRPQVITGEVVPGVPGLPMVRPLDPPRPPSRPVRRKRGRRRWPWILLSVVWAVFLVVVGVPAILLGVPLLHDQLAAEAGEASPTVALEKFVYTFEDDSRAGELSTDRLIVGSQRSAVLKVRRDYLAGALG
jgi:hypothetical protein